jgi:hypothetical protein
MDNFTSKHWHSPKIKMYKIVITALLFVLLLPNKVTAQENQKDKKNWLKRHFEQRIYLGYYDSFGDEKANVLQAGYDAVLNLINIKPTWHLLDFCLGLDVLLVRDQIKKEVVDNFGHIRTTDNRLIPAFELNWGVRLHFLPISKIKTTLYLEAVPMSLVVYAKPYPDNGTYVNVGTHLGLGMKYSINDKLKAYTTIRWFSHTSNGTPEVNNPALDMVGLVMGLQF